MSPPTFTALTTFWRAVPFRAMLLLVLFLFFVKERYPFSNFPMYADLDEEASILYITDQADQALPMASVFRTGSGTSKKMFKKELNVVTKTAGRKLENATAEDRAAAGHAVMTTILERLRPNRMPAAVSHLRLYRKIFRLQDGGLAHLEPERLVERPVPKFKP